MHLRWFILVLCVTVFVGCEDTNVVPIEGGPYIDSSTEESFEKSVAIVRATVAVEDRDAFDRGLEKLLGNTAVHRMLNAGQALPGMTDAAPPAMPGGAAPMPKADLVAPENAQPREKREARRFVHLMNAADILREGGQLKTTVYDATIRANEATAIASLEAIAQAQFELQAQTAIDVDQDENGEFGVFGELAGSVQLRAAPDVERKVLEDPLVPARFSRVKHRVVTMAGYHFQIFLPGSGGSPVKEDPFGGYSGKRVDTDLSEKVWCCVAWPVTPGESGRRVFFINQEGTTLAHANEDGALGKDGVPVNPMLVFKSETRRMDGELDFVSAPKKGRWTDKL